VGAILLVVGLAIFFVIILVVHRLTRVGLVSALMQIQIWLILAGFNMVILITPPFFGVVATL